MSKKGKNKKFDNSVFNSESIGFTLAAFLFLLFFISVTGELVFSTLGAAVCAFLFGLFGFATYFVLVWLFLCSIGLIIGRSPIPSRWIVLFGSLLLFVGFFTAHDYATAQMTEGKSFMEYLGACYELGAQGPFATPFGAVGAIVVYPVAFFVKPVLSYVLFTLLSLTVLYFAVKFLLADFGIHIRIVGKDSLSSFLINAIGKSMAEAEKRKKEARQKEEREKQERAERANTMSGNATTPYDNAPYSGNGYSSEPNGANGYANSAVQNGYASSAAPNGYAPAGGSDPYYGMSQTQRMLAKEREELIDPDEPVEVDPTDRAANVQFLYGSQTNEEYRKKNLIFDEGSSYNKRPKDVPTFGNALAERERATGVPPATTYSGLYSRTMDEENTPYVAEKRVVDGKGEIIRTESADLPQTSSGYSLYNTDVYGKRETNLSPNNNGYSAGGTGGSYFRASFSASEKEESTRTGVGGVNGATGGIDIPGNRNGTTGSAGNSMPTSAFFSSSFSKDRTEESPSRESWQESRRTDSESEETLSGRTEREVFSRREGLEETDERSPFDRQSERTEREGSRAAFGGEEDGTLPSRTEREQTFNGDFAPVREDDRIDAPEDKDENPDRVEDRRNTFRGMFANGERSGKIDEIDEISKTDESGERGLERSDRNSRVNLFDERDERETDFSGERRERATEQEEELPKTNVPDFTASREAGRRGYDESAPADTTGRGVVVGNSDDEGEKKPQKATPKPRVIRDYVQPPIDILLAYDDSVSVSQEEIENAQRGIVDTLKGFNIIVGIKRVVTGPVFTRYDIELPKSVDIGKIERRKNEIALRIHSGNINIYANFTEGTVSIEVPNHKRATVGLKSMMLSENMRNAKRGSLTFAVGVDAEGRCVSADLCKMPHMLVAGTTGSGKSVFLHEMIVSLIMRYSPEEMRMILIDPKWTEFSVYENLPHLMINEIITDVKRVIVALNWAIQEMERRYMLFAQMTQKGVAVRTVDEYNEAMEKREDKLPKIVIIADEVADLMSQAKNDVENRVNRLAAKARAAGIHLVLATQRPSVNVITGVLKSNLPSRVALRVSSEVDSRVIMDATGAENLLGQGDLLYKTNGMYDPKRVQGAWIATPEIQKICDYIRNHNESYFDEQVATYIDSEGKTSMVGEEEEEKSEGEIEPVYVDALRFVVQTGSASISMIQRKCSVGFNKAGKIVEWMEQSGYISAFDGAKSRKVLLTKEAFEEKFGEL